MTRETKVGLFVGLAFIILFAVLISERGGSERKTSPPAFASAQLTPGDGSRSAQLHANGAGGQEGRLPVERALAQKNTPPAHVIPQPAESAARLAEGPRPRDLDLPTIPEKVPGRDDPTKPGEPTAASPSDSTPAPLPAETPALADNRRGTLVIPPSLEPHRSKFETVPGITPAPGAVLKDQESRVAKTAPDGPAKSADDRKLPEPSGPTFAERNRLDSKTVETTVPGTPAANDASRLAKSQPDTRNRVTHHIRPGESLAKISKRYYGTQSPQVITALFEANRDVLSDPANIPADRDIMIPVLAGYENRFKNAADVAAKPRPAGQPHIPAPLTNDRAAKADTKKPANGDNKAGAPEKAKPARVYAVRPNDTLRKIAARELGDPNRFREIYELNRDQLDSPDDVDPGDELKLPPRNKPRAERPAAPGDDSVATRLSSRMSRR